jgi:hypothetical protein
MTLRHRHHPDNLNDCRLFAEASEREIRHDRPCSWPVRVIARRHNLPKHRAALIAELAGIGGTR